jgi:predicted N-acetyltransferase YhbS
MADQTAPARIRPIAEADVDDVVALATGLFGAETAPDPAGELRGQVAQWQFAKSPVVVARTAEGVFAGYARATPFEVETSPRPEGQVVVLTQLAVVPALRGRGIGTALLKRVLTTSRMLGYARAVASLPEAAAGFFAAREWEVLAAGHGRAWIEPHIARDDLWLPDERSGVFSPILTVQADPAHPLEAWTRLADRAPLVQAEYTSVAQLDAAFAAAIAADPAAAAALPPKTRELLGF